MTATHRRLRTALGELELYNEPAPGKTLSEDVVDAADSAAWLLDAASASDDRQACDEHDAVWYGRQLSAAIAEQLATYPRCALHDVLASAIEDVTSEHHRTCAQARHGHGPSSTVAIVRRNDDSLEYLVLGDSTLLVESGDTVHHHSDKRLATVAHDLRRAISEGLRAGARYDDDAHLRRVAALRAAERAARNTSHGYWIASDLPDAAHQALTGTYALEPGIHRLAVLSDGVERAVSRLGIYKSHGELFEALFVSGPAACVSAIRRAEARCPERREFPPTARFDDGSALTCRTEPTPRGSQGAAPG